MSRQGRWPGPPVKEEPWWLYYVIMAERRNRFAWELFDEWTPKRFWRECMGILDSARNEVDRARGAKSP